MKYQYPAIFKKEPDGYSVRFPDLTGCNTQGDSLTEALEMAQDALETMLSVMDAHTLKQPSEESQIPLKQDEQIYMVDCEANISAGKVARRTEG